MILFQLLSSCSSKSRRCFWFPAARDIDALMMFQTHSHIQYFLTEKTQIPCKVCIHMQVHTKCMCVTHTVLIRHTYWSTKTCQWNLEACLRALLSLKPFGSLCCSVAAAAAGNAVDSFSNSMWIFKLYMNTNTHGLLLVLIRYGSQPVPMEHYENTSWIKCKHYTKHLYYL